MDCDTTGVEPDIALVKYKLLAGGGTLKSGNRTVPEALSRLGYTADEVKKIVAHVEEFDSIEDVKDCLLYTSPSPRDGLLSRMPSSA